MRRRLDQHDAVRRWWLLLCLWRWLQRGRAQTRAALASRRACGGGEQRRGGEPASKGRHRRVPAAQMPLLLLVP